MYLALHDNQLSNIGDIAKSFKVSRNHLVKVVHHLVQIKLLDSVRGRGGGIRLARDAHEINIGDVLRHTEQTLEIIDCNKPACPLLPSCKLKRVLNDAKTAFFAVLDEYTVADLTKNNKLLLKLIA